MDISNINITSINISMILYNIFVFVYDLFEEFITGGNSHEL